MHEGGGVVVDGPGRHAGVPPARGGERFLDEEVLEAEEGDAAGVVGVRRVAVGREDGGVGGLGGEPFEERPAEVLAGMGDHVHFVEGALHDVAEVEDTGVCAVGLVVRGIRSDAEAEGVAEAERPDARGGGSWILRIEPGVAGESVAGAGVEAEDFPGERVDHLGAEDPDVFLRAEDAVGEGGVAAVGHGPARVEPIPAGAVADGNQERTVFAEGEAVHVVAEVSGDRPVGKGLSDEYVAAVGQDGSELRGVVEGVASDTADGVVVELVGVRVVKRRAEVLEVVVVDGVSEVDKAVVLNVRVDRQPDEPHVEPGADFVADVDEGRGLDDAVLKEADASGFLPDDAAAVGEPGDAGGLVEIVDEDLLHEARGERGGGSSVKCCGEERECGERVSRGHGDSQLRATTTPHERGEAETRGHAIRT